MKRICTLATLLFILMPSIPAAAAQATEVYKAYSIRFWPVRSGYVAIISKSGVYQHSLAVGSRRQARYVARKWVDLVGVGGGGMSRQFVRRNGGDDMELPFAAYGQEGRVRVEESSFGPRLLIHDDSVIPPLLPWAEARFEVFGNAWSLGISGQAIGDAGVFELEEVGTGFRPFQVDPGSLDAVYIRSAAGGASEVSINYSGLDLDTRIQGDSHAELLFVDAGTDRVGVGTDSPTALLDVDGGTDAGTVEIDGNAGACLKLRDRDDAGWTYCTALNGRLSCSTTPC